MTYGPVFLICTSRLDYIMANILWVHTDTGKNLKERTKVVVLNQWGQRDTSESTGEILQNADYLLSIHILLEHSFQLILILPPTSFLILRHWESLDRREKALALRIRNASFKVLWPQWDQWEGKRELCQRPVEGSQCLESVVTWGSIGRRSSQALELPYRFYGSQ